MVKKKKRTISTRTSKKVDQVEKSKKTSTPKKLKPVEKAEKKDKSIQKKDYILCIGRRKSSVARVRYYKKDKNELIVNGKDYKDFFSYFEFQKIVKEPYQFTDKLSQGKISVKVKGGGIRGQAESIRLGISRILLELDQDLRKILRSNNLLTRDPRVKERKKYGLRKARRAPQWQKR